MGQLDQSSSPLNRDGRLAACHSSSAELLRQISRSTSAEWFRVVAALELMQLAAATGHSINIDELAMYDSCRRRPGESE